MDNFKNRARIHQASFLKNALQCKPENGSLCILSEIDAREGKNFYNGFDGFVKKVESRYSFDKRKAMYSNMLRSEHIPFNFFLPFTMQDHLCYLTDIFNAVHPCINLTRIGSLKIEWAPEKKEQHLDDLTSFDVYIQAQSDLKRVGIGIEVKYTETSYPYGETEYRRMFDVKEGSTYHKFSADSKLYLDGAIEQLREKSLKQIWRNHLLGAAMLLQPRKEIDVFYSLHLFPAQNLYQKKVCSAYQALLKPDAKQSFVPLTFERFIDIAKIVCKKDKKYIEWLDYLSDRYIVK